MRALLTISLSSILLYSCGGELVRVPRGQHPLTGGATPVAVDSAPPPARIDELDDPEPPQDGCAWADGRYQWEDNHWVWQPGHWVRVAEGCYYADSLIVWVPSVAGGVLFYTPGQWYKEGGEGSCPPPERC